MTEEGDGYSVAVPDRWPLFKKCLLPSLDEPKQSSPESISPTTFSRLGKSREPKSNEVHIISGSIWDSPTSWMPGIHPEKVTKEAVGQQEGAVSLNYHVTLSCFLCYRSYPSVPRTCGPTSVSISTGRYAVIFIYPYISSVTMLNWVMKDAIMCVSR